MSKPKEMLNGKLVFVNGHAGEIEEQSLEDWKSDHLSRIATGGICMCELVRKSEGKNLRNILLEFAENVDRFISKNIT